jgi:AcrR family transcriptional regulator
MAEDQRTYHHGNLRAALVQAALELVEEAGSPALSLRAIAAAAGVSRAAPYAHFRDRRALLSAVANAGFERLALGMTAADDPAATPRERFVGIGRAYVRFALDNPHLFKLMFSAELETRTDQPAIEGSATYDLFSGSLATLSRGVTPATGSVAMEAMAWSMIHGLAFLLIEGRLPVPGGDRDSLVRQVADGFAELLQGR